MVVSVCMALGSVARIAVALYATAALGVGGDRSRGDVHGPLRSVDICLYSLDHRGLCTLAARTIARRRETQRVEQPMARRGVADEPRGDDGDHDSDDEVAHLVCS